MKKIKSIKIVLFALMLCMGMSAFANLKHYPYVSVKNDMSMPVKIDVTYSFPGACKPDHFDIMPGQTKTASSRGACLVQEITGTTTTTKHTLVPYKPFSSTSYSEFRVKPSQSYDGILINGTIVRIKN